MASFLSDLFGGGAEKEAAQKDIAAAQGYQAQAVPTLQQYYGQGQGYLNQGIGAYQPLVNLGAQYSGAAPSYMGAIGAGTPEQNAAAITSFYNTPGYKAMLDSASQAVQRQEAAGGMGASGNADINALMASTGITNQQYQQYINNLQQAGQMGLGATQAGAAGQAAGYGGLANLASQQGQNLANVYGNVEQQTVGANNLQAAGEAQGAKNLLGAGLAVASLATGGAGGLGGLGSMLGGAGSSIGSGLASGFGSLMGQNWQQSNPGAWGSQYQGPVAPSNINPW